MIGAARATVMRKHVRVIGPVALISRADLRLTATRAAALRDDLNVRHLLINAETRTDAQALQDAGFYRIADARHVADLTLEPSTHAMAAALHQKWRNRLRKGQSNGLTLRRSPLVPDTRHWLFRAEAQQARKLRYHPVPPQVVVALADASPGCAQVFTAYHLGARVAAMLFLRHGSATREATYQIGWIAPQGRRLNAGQALMWKAMVDLQSMGTQTIDLGAADWDRSADLARFKCGTGAVIRPLGGTWLDTAWARHKSFGQETDRKSWQLGLKAFCI